MALIRQIAADSSCVIWTKHVRERMEQRGIDAVDVLHILKSGTVEGVPEDGANAGELKVKLIKRLSSGREAGVVVVLVSEHTRIKLVTTEWEDLK